MTTMSNDEYAKAVLALAQPSKFEPHAYYDADGDCIEFLVSDEPFYGERVDDLVTVYYGQESKEIIGSLIKSVSKLCAALLKDFPGFKIEIHDGRVRLEHVFRARLWTSKEEPDALPTRTYRKLLEIAEESCVETECMIC